MNDRLDAIRRLACSSNSSLKSVVERVGPLDCIRSAGYVDDVARQLIERHALQQFHGDVRPGNILLDEHGSARLLAQNVFSDGTDDLVGADYETVTDAVDCLAPEQALNAATVDGRADIYSLGCTLYFLLAGRPPFPNGSISERLLQHQTRVAEPIRTIRSDVPQALSDICEQMMAKKPSDRFQTAHAVIDAIAAWRSGER